MKREKIYEELTGIFRDVFLDDTIEINDATVAGDIAGWDSLMHITLIGAVEDEFNITFPMKDVLGMKNVGEMVDAIERLAD